MNLLSYIFRAVQIAPYQGVGSLTPPTVAPFLEAEVDLGSFIAKLKWTASDKTGSPGFGYNIYISLDGSIFNLQYSTTGLTYDYDSFPDGGTFWFKVIPFNDAGEGPESNPASIILPGESNPQALLLEDGAAALLEDGTELLLESA